MAWSVDRLVRSLQDLIAFLSEIHAAGVDLYLHQQGLDTSTPAGKAMFQMLGVLAEFERALIRERVMAGLARASTARRPASRSAPEGGYQDRRGHPAVATERHRHETYSGHGRGRHRHPHQA
jgi:DNA invertase Pin-like site-specific DNA recombinase